MKPNNEGKDGGKSGKYLNFRPSQQIIDDLAGCTHFGEASYYIRRTLEKHLRNEILSDKPYAYDHVSTVPAGRVPLKPIQPKPYGPRKKKLRIFPRRSGG